MTLSIISEDPLEMFINYIKNNGNYSQYIHKIEKQKYLNRYTKI